MEIELQIEESTLGLSVTRVVRALLDGKEAFVGRQEILQERNDFRALYTTTIRVDLAEKEG